MLALIEAGLDRQTAYQIVQRNSMRAWDEGGHLRDYLRSESEVTALLSPDEIDQLFDIDYHLAHIPTTFERVGLPALDTSLAGARS
jgi:adenylosuccinate lyase